MSNQPGTSRLIERRDELQFFSLLNVTRRPRMAAESKAKHDFVANVTDDTQNVTNVFQSQTAERPLHGEKLA